MLLSSGTGGYRIDRAMKRTARSLGFDHCEVEVSLTGIVCTATRGENFRTVVRHSENIGVNARRIQAVERLSRNLPAAITHDRINAELDAIEKATATKWPPAVLMPAAGLACAAFAWLNYFPLADCVAVAGAAAAGRGAGLLLSRKRLNQLGVTAISAVVACLAYFVLQLLGETLGIIGSSDAFEPGYVAAVLFLVPGFPLFTSLLDIAQFNFNSGVARLAYAMTILMTSTMAVATVASTVGVRPLVVPNVPASYTTWYAAALVSSFVGVFGFSLLFNSRLMMALVAALFGTIANAVRLAMVHAGANWQTAALVGATVVGLLAGIRGVTKAIPRICLTVPAAVIMIPGTAMYRSVHFLSSGGVAEALPFLAQAIMQVLFLGAGLVLARMLTDRQWAFHRPIRMVKPAPE